MTEIPILLVIATLAGAFLNVIRGVAGTTDPFNYRLFVGTLITASLAAITAATLLDITGVTDIVALVILGLITGFGADFGIAKLKNK